MQNKDLENFFEKVGAQVKSPVKIYLTGGVAAWFWGGRRPTLDLDFALEADQDWEEISAILIRLGQATGLPLEFSEDISRWGMVGYSDFKRGAKFFNRWGEVEVYFLDPIVWSVGKIARYTLDDIADLQAVFKKQNIDPGSIVKLWAQAFRESPRSTELGLFKKKVCDFFTDSGPKIWGKSFEAQKFIEQFLQKIS